MKYWWVNHKQTVRQEIGGGYLWSPKRESGERKARSQFYDNMTRAKPGDVVLSYANQQIGWIGRVADFAFSAPKPDEFGTVGKYWDKEGWLLPIVWTGLEPAVRPRGFSEQLGALLPTKYSPYNPKTGSGNQKAYLAEVSEAVFDLVRHHTRFGSDVAVADVPTYERVRERLGDEAQALVLADMALSDTEKGQVVKARRGQGLFRKNVEAREKSCRLTGITNSALLIASHIKPWRLCTTAAERLDGANGLLLTPDADRLFDRGFISFAPDGSVILSERLPVEDFVRLGFGDLVGHGRGMADSAQVWGADLFDASQQMYLNFHREVMLVR